LSDGAGSVTVQQPDPRQLAGAGDGASIHQMVSGRDVRLNANQPNSWYRLNIVNNMIVNNVAAFAGGGISLQDSARVRILHNTIAHNDSTATAGEAFPTATQQTESTPQPAGIVSRNHAPELNAAIGNSAGVQQYKLFSNPDLRNNIIWENRSFYFTSEGFDATDPLPYGLVAATPPYQDLAVLGVTGLLNPRFCTLTSLTATGPTPGTYHASNSTADPAFVREYFNGDRGQTILNPDIASPIAAPAAFAEGGNFIKLRFGPLTLNRIVEPDLGQPYGDYHLQNNSPAEASGQQMNQLPALADITRDFDADPRPIPNNSRPDTGADERP
jgi:parallel beta-helix repeat protein